MVKMYPFHDYEREVELNISKIIRKLKVGGIPGISENNKYELSEDKSTKST